MTDAQSAFWALFTARAPELAASGSAESDAYEELLARLHELDPGLSLEFCSEPGACELVVSADGHADLFPLAREIVAAAPVVEGWTLRALKPKLGFPLTTRWGALTLTIADLLFEPLGREGSDDLGVRVFVPGLDDADVDDAHNAVLRAMDHGLGEEQLAAAVQFVDVLPLPADVDPDDLVALADLEAFIEWRNRDRRSDG